ncbi:MAG TPA: hypothetical protein VFX60_16000 [Micromonospora sp.]|nr:hypothetical protein [Micromonospora sp.]
MSRWMMPRRKPTGPPNGWSLNVPTIPRWRVLYLPPWLARLTDRLRGR